MQTTTSESISKWPIKNITPPTKRFQSDILKEINKATGSSDDVKEMDMKHFITPEKAVQYFKDHQNDTGLNELYTNVIPWLELFIKYRTEIKLMESGTTFYEISKRMEVKKDEKEEEKEVGEKSSTEDSI